MKRNLFSAKLGYQLLEDDDFTGEVKAWWSPLWKVNAPLKVKNLTWLVLENKILTWDNGVKHGWIGPSWCVLCRNNEETMHHLFISCSFVQNVWVEVCAYIEMWFHNSGRGFKWLDAELV
jgi:hypothetical protein